jgi:hypothetical protein
MIVAMDLGLLADPARCPSCAAGLPAGAVRCPSCALPLRGADARRLWEVSLAAAELLAERERLIDRLRAAPAPAAPAPVSPATTVPPAIPRRTPAARSRESSRTEVQNILLGLGVLLLAVAALIFTVVTWGRLGIGGRALVLAAITTLSVGASVLTLRRGLAATAEATAVLTVGLLLLDAYALRKVGLAGLDELSPRAYWAFAFAVVAGMAAAAATVHRLVSVRLTAAVGGQLPVFVAASLWTQLEASTVFVIQAALTALLAARLRPAEVRMCLGAGAAVAFVVGVVPAAGLAYGASGADGLRPALVLALATAAAVVTAWVWRAEPAARAVAAGAATLTGFAAMHGPFTQSLGPVRAVAYAAAIVLVVVLALRTVPAPWHTGPLAALAFPALAALLAAAPSAALAVATAFRPLDEVWLIRGSGPADVFDELDRVDLWFVIASLLVLAAALAVTAQLARGLRPSLLGTAALALLGWHLVPLAADAPYLLAVAWDVGAGGALVALATWRYPRGGWPLALAAGVVLAGLGLGWSLATQSATLFGLGLALVAVLGSLAIGRVGTAPGLLAAGVAVVAAEVFVALRAIDWPADRAGFCTVACCGLLAVAGGRLLRDPLSGEAVEIAAAASAVAAFLPVLPDLGWTSHTLLAAGVAAALVAARPERRPVGWVAGVLLTASSWTRLSLEDVTAPEAYTVPPALALLAVGFLRHRKDPQVSSWAAFGTGLVLALGPSLLWAIGDDGLGRPLLLGLAALTVTLAGARFRLQAPLLVGGAVLAVDAAVQVAPYVDALPRWVSVAAAGLLLVVFGATYERRLRDLRRLQDGLRRLS